MKCPHRFFLIQFKPSPSTCDADGIRRQVDSLANLMAQSEWETVPVNRSFTFFFQFLASGMRSLCD